MISRTILIADDDRLVRESLCDVLRGLGLETSEAASGRLAIEWLRAHRCDLLLSDVDMPDMSGFQVLSWVTAQGRAAPSERAGADGLDRCRAPVPVVLMSARADAQLDRQARAAGALHLWSKPVEITRIQTFLQEHFAS
jgi:CheY-like chemotaxis protein